MCECKTWKGIKCNYDKPMLFYTHILQEVVGVEWCWPDNEGSDCCLPFRNRYRHRIYLNTVSGIWLTLISGFLLALLKGHKGGWVTHTGQHAHCIRASHRGIPHLHSNGSDLRKLPAPGRVMAWWPRKHLWYILSGFSLGSLTVNNTGIIFQHFPETGWQGSLGVQHSIPPCFCCQPP